MFDRIDLDYSHALSVTWDVGRRCNLDCTYCPSYRHDNFSPSADLKALKSAAHFVFQYLDLYLRNRTNRAAKIDFTGGEPTINPHFSEFSKWLRQTHQELYADKFSFEVNLTSNGIINDKMRDSVLQNFDYATFSYHTESTAAQKQRFFNHMKFFKEKNFPSKVNVMFHAKPDYFQECLELCDKLREEAIDFVPRLIGEKDNKDRYNHQYTSEQLQWFREYWKNPDKAKFELPPSNPVMPMGEKSKDQSTEVKQAACSVGRPCCGNRKMHVGNSEDSQQTTFVESVDFKDWYCSVNWFFLHIEQQTGEVFHHQTCQARFDYSRGPIGHLNQSEKILQDLKERMKPGKMPLIQCSKKTCACGLCAPKARYAKDLKTLLPKHVNAEVFIEEVDIAAPGHPL